MLSPPQIKLSITLFFILTTITQKAQIYLVEEWVHTTGIPDTVDYSASTIDGSGNIYVTTNTISATEKANVLTTKYNSSGVVQWEIEKDNTDENDYGSAIDVDGSGNVYVAAATWVDGTNKYDYLVIKYNSSGIQQWTATYNGPGNFYDIPTDIFVDGSGNVYVTGASYGSGTLSDYCTIKYNASGTQQWASRYDYSSDQDIAAILKEAPSGRIVVIGASENAPGSYDFAMVKYNQNTGAQITSNRNSASGTGFDQVYGADVDASGNIYITGRASVVDEGYNMKTVKLDTSLAVVWSKNYDFAGLDDESHGVVVDLENNVYITGWITNENLSKSMVTVKYNVSGTLQWYSIVDAVSSNLNATGLEISSKVDGNIIVAGNIDNGQSIDFLTLIYSKDGDKLWMEQYDSPDKIDDKVNFAKSDIGDAFYVGGISYGASTATNRLIKYTSHDLLTPPDDDLLHPSSFTYFENKGQIKDTEDDTREDIKFYTHRVIPSLYFTNEIVSYVWAKIDTSEEVDTVTRIDMSFVGANGTTEINRAISQGEEFMNYYLPQCPEGVTNVRSADRLIVPDLYPNVDLQYYFDGGGLKYYIIINPGWSEQNDPISILYDGAVEINIIGGGELQIVGALEEIIQAVPDAYQIDAYGDIVPLAWNADYIQIDDFEIGFDLGAYDDDLPLVIEFKMAGMLGGDEDCIDNVIWGTWFGGNKNDFPTDVEMTLVADGNPSLYVAGVTTTTLYPADLLVSFDYSGQMSDIYIQKFSGEGDLYNAKWGTVLGGSDNEEYPGVPEGPKISAFQGGTEIIFVGTTYSSDLGDICVDYNVASNIDMFDDTKNFGIGGFDGVAGFLNYDSGTLGWLTYVGGSYGTTNLFGIDSYIDEIVIVGRSDGGATGITGPEGFFPDDFESGGSNIVSDLAAGGPGQGGAVIIELNGQYESIFETLFDGGSPIDELRDVIIDVNKDEGMPKYPYYIVGRTNGDELQTTTGAFQEIRGGGSDAYIAKIVPDEDVENSRDVVFCSYYGGAGGETGLFITLDEDKSPYITGISRDYGIDLSENLPTECPPDVYCVEEFIGDESTYFDIFLTKFNSDASAITYGSYFGGDYSTYPYDLVTDGDYIILVGYTWQDYETFPMWDYDGAYFDDDSEEPEENAGFIALWDKNMNNLWSTYLGDNAWSRASAATVFKYLDRRELYVVGTVTYDHLNFTYRPLCNDALPDAYFMPEANTASLSNSDGYINAFDLNIFEPILTGFTETIIEDNIFVFPNPTTQHLNIISDEMITSIIIYDMMGNVVFSVMDINQKHTQIDVRLLPTSCYTLVITHVDQQFYSKFIKE